MNVVLAIALKDLRLLARDRVSCFFAFVFPLVVAIFFGVIFSGAGSGGDGSSEKRIEVLLVDEDKTDGSAAFAKTLKGASELSVTDATERGEALDLVRRGEQTAAIVLPKGFGASRDGLFWSSGTTIGLGVDPSRRAEAGMLEGILTKYGFAQMQEGFAEPKKLKEQVQRSRERLQKSDTNLPTKLIFNKFFGDMDAMLSAIEAQEGADNAGGGERGSETGNAAGNVAGDAGNASDSAQPTSGDASNNTTKPTTQTATGGWQPMTIVKLSVTQPKPAGDEHGARAIKPQSSFALTFPQGIIWGVMGCALGFSASLVGERSSGTLLRLRVAPISARQILLGKALACFVSTQVVSILLLVIGAMVFGVRPSSWPLTLLAIACTGVCFVGIMMLLAVFSPSERGGSGLGWGVLLILSMIGGGMIPLFFMPGWMQSLSLLSPIRWAVLSIEGGIWRGFTPGEMAVPLLVLVAIGVAGLVIGARVFGLSRRA